MAPKRFSPLKEAIPMIERKMRASAEADRVDCSTKPLRVENTTQKSEHDTARFRKCFSASLTVEAAIVVPFFLFVTVALLSVVEFYHIHGEIKAILWEENRQASVRNLVLDNTGTVISSATNTFLLKKKLTERLDEGTLWRSMIWPSKEGLVASEINGGSDSGQIKLDCFYMIRPICSFVLPVKKSMEVHLLIHDWTGYKPDISVGTSEGEVVYVAETGEVYHINRYCTYLNPSVTGIKEEELPSARNLSGGKYSACPMCKPQKGTGKYYVTNYGTVYHCSLECSGLKRTVYEVELRVAAATLRPCSKCSGG